MTSHPMVRVRGLAKSYGDTTALAGIDLDVPRGSVVGLLGPNGAGKTTAVRIISTLLSADAGTVTVAGLDVRDDAHRVRQMLGLTGQYAALDEQLSGRQNLELFGVLLGMSRREARRRSAELLDDFGLTEAAHRAVKTFSGGMRRRLDLAASLLGRPELLVLDEPTTGLDPARREEMWRTVRRLVAEGATVLLTTQYLEEADALADSVTVIARGEVVAEGTPAQIKQTVGGRRIEVIPEDPGDLEKTTEILSRVTGHAPRAERRSGVSVDVVDDALLAPVATALAEAGVAVSELALRLPSLDEAFLALVSDSESDDPTDVAKENPR